MTRILVVEDDPDLRELLADILLDAGYDVVEAADGSSALEMSCDAHPDVVILDWMLPDLDGLQVLEKLKGDPETRSIPVIIATARDRELGEPTARSAGASDFISKPWQPGEVQSAVKNLENRAARI